MLCLSLRSGALEALKWLALAAMVLDHVNAVWFARELGTWATAAGRVAMPLFSLVLAYNLARPGADHSATLRRLALFGALATPAYAYLFAFDGAIWPLNIMATFAVAVGGILLSERKHVHLRAYGLALLVGGGFLVEYWLPGVWLVVAAYGYFRHGGVARLGFVGVALVALCIVNGNAWALLSLPILAAAAVVPVSLPRSPRLFWWFYPAHLTAIALAHGLT